MGRRNFRAAAALMLALTSGAAAQDQGIGIAQSPDETFQACHGANPQAALDCARDKCRKSGGSNCMRVRWCYPAGYSGAMSYLADRAITHVALHCGAPGEAALLAALAARCQADASATECRLMVLWTPDGSESERTDRLGKNTAD